MLEKKVTIRCENITITAFLNESQTARSLWNALPIEGITQRWGDEIYFSIPVDDVERNAVDVVEIGNLAYWPPGNALCIFFGPTPASLADECRAASPVNIIGKIEGDISSLRNIASGLPIGVLQEQD